MEGGKCGGREKERFFFMTQKYLDQKKETFKCFFFNLIDTQNNEANTASRKEENM